MHLCKGMAAIPVTKIAEEAYQALAQFDTLTPHVNLRMVKFVDVNKKVIDELASTMRYYLNPVPAQTTHYGNSHGVAAGQKASVLSCTTFDRTSLMNDLSTREKDEMGTLNVPLIPSTRSLDHKPEASITKPSATLNVSSNSNDSREICSICMDPIEDSVRSLPCGHSFHSSCIKKQFNYQPKCPCCGKIYGQLRGEVLKGQIMLDNKTTDRLAGYPECGTIEINYMIPDGSQQVSHIICCQRLNFVKTHVLLLQSEHVMIL